MIFRAEERCQERSGENEKARSKMKRASVNNSRQRPTLPHTYACSTIGGGRLNFRVRNGNGCDPAPMTTGKLAVVRIVRSVRIVRRVRQTGCLGSRRVERSIPPRCIALSVRPKLFQRAESAFALALRRDKLNTLQTVVLFLGSTRMDREVSCARYCA